MTGSGQYARCLLAALTEADDGNEYVLVGPADARPNFLAGRLWRWRTVETPFRRLSRQLDKVWFEQVSLPSALSAEEVDLVHYPYFASPLFPTNRVVVTLHDLIPLLLKPYRGSPAVRLYTCLVAAAARRAHGIIADSECTRTDIVRLLGISQAKVSVVYLAADERFKPIEDREAVKQVCRKFGLGDNVILYLGGLDHRKNVGALIGAFAQLRRAFGGLQLAIAGQPTGQSKLFPDIRRVVYEAGVQDQVVFLGPVSEEDRPLLYNAARLFVFPSLYEGFGLPPLEAMACGTVVACSNASSLPEIVGDAALTFDPRNQEAMVEAMRKGLVHGALRDEMRAKGLERARGFSWRKTALETLRVYDSVCSLKR